MTIVLVLVFLLFVFFFSLGIKFFKHHFSKLLPSAYITTIVVSDKRIVVSLSTSPDRISKIKPMIDSILNQTIVVDKIYLNLPYVYLKTGKTFDTLPEFITLNPKIHVNQCKDIGPATKILPTLELENDPETIIISVDDDIYYEPNVINSLLYYSLMYPDACITGSSFISHPTKGNLSFFSRIYYSQLLEGFSGVLYKVKFINSLDTKNIENYPRYCFLADDLTLSNYLLKQKTPILCIDILSHVKPLDYGLGEDALHSNNGNLLNYSKCLGWLSTNDDNNFIDINSNSVQKIPNL